MLGVLSAGVQDRTGTYSNGDVASQLEVHAPECHSLH